MSKRYQVFVSSTYADLKDERQAVMQALMELDCIPAGMELFPAADEEQLRFIERVIDDCDYYLLIIGGRYGSVTASGISFTEKEFDYAVSKGIKVIAFLHSEPESIPAGKSEKDPALRKQLEEFRSKVSTGRLVKHWSKADELPGQVALSLAKTIKTYPAVGWVRANKAASDELLSELNEVRRENSRLRVQLEQASKEANNSCSVDNIAGLDYAITVTGTARSGATHSLWSAKVTFGQLFAAIGPHLVSCPSEFNAKNILSHAAAQLSGSKLTEPRLEESDFQTITIQFKALGLISLQYAKNTKGYAGVFWHATEKGDRATLELRTVKVPNSVDE